MKRSSFLETGKLVLLLLVSTVLIFSCEKNKTTPTGGEAAGTIIADLSASSDSVLVGDNTVIISAMVTTDGQPDSGKVVGFSVSPAFMGAFPVSSCTTNADGQVLTVFHSNNNDVTGSASVIARTSDVSSSIKVYVVSSEGPPTGEGGLRIQVDPSVLPANGDTTSEVTITVKGANNLPVPDGTIVRLAAGEKFEDVDGDGYYNKDIDHLIYDTNNDGIWNPIGNIPNTATTSSGVATATYTAGHRAGMVYVKATAGSPDNPVTNDEVILLVPTTGDSVASIALQPASPTIQVKGTGGIEFVQMTATCYDDNGNRVIEGWPVIFDILNGPPDGGQNINGSADPCTVLTNSSGIAQVTVNSGIKSGTINLIAYFGNVISNSTRITVCAGPPKFISIGVTPCNIRGFDVVNVEAQVGAVVVDSFGNYVPNGTSVYFSTDEGMVTPSDETEGGVVSATYRSAPKPGDDGVAWIKAETAGGTIKDSVYLIVSGAPYYVDFLSYPSSGIAATSKAYGTIYVGITDVNGNPVLAGLNVDFEASYGSIGDSKTDSTCIPGDYALAKSKYTSTNLEVDYSWTTPDDGIGATELVSAKCGGAGGFVTFPLLTGSSYKDETNTYSRIIADDAIDYGSLGSFSVKITDCFTNPLGGHVVNVINISNGTLVGSGTDITDAYGLANFIFQSADYDTLLKSVNITVADTADHVRGGIFLSKKISLSPG